VARHQQNVTDKLKWDKTALQHALNIPDESVKATLPSLYLNVGKCYEDLGDNHSANANYQTALSFCDFLSGDGYGKMIRAGIMNGLERTN
jgi:rifampin ADP-ribosylating transferase